MNENESRIPRTLAVIHVNNIVMYPYIMIPLVVSDESLKRVIDYALGSDKLLGFFLSREENEHEGDDEIYNYGAAVSILRMLRNNDGSISLLLQGVSRIKMEKVVQRQPFMMVEVTPIPEDHNESAEILASRKVALELLEKIAEETPDVNRELVFGLRNIKQSSRVADIIAGNLNFPVDQKQDVLETAELKARYQKLNRYLAEMIRQARLENRIRRNIQLEMDEDQRRYYLHEQLDAIRKELGETDEVDQEIDKWRKAISKANLPDYVEETANEELDRMAVMSPASSEYGVVRNYLEWLVNLPWKDYSKDRLDIKRIHHILTEDHYGLDKPKERILEFISVKKLRSQLKGPILCFVGPPGVGKTSLGRSIARAMNRKFIRLSLGGIHDEAEIRGHRRTYIGALPGKILNEIKRCGKANPVFMLDEIDKVGSDFRGDPSSALLEVLDPEQNSTFMDNYINLPFDLSEVMFITTANGLDTIPPPLRDRMEIIEFSSYLENEKIEIAKHYLVPRELENNGLKKSQVKFEVPAIQELIRFYVRESGVRNLQRRIGSILRKIARKVAEGSKEKFKITDANVKDYLGRRKFMSEIAKRQPEVGVTTGLAWTVFGGEILFCEATLMPGKGKLILTGSLGKVMKESAKIALSFLKANHDKYGFSPDLLEQSDIHVHFPSGATPKDGPSAGVTLTTTLASLLTGKKVRHDFAMTGEVTLQGKVLPVGGIREKVLGARRAGITKVFLPLENQDEFEEIDPEIRQGIDAVFVEHVNQIFEQVLI